MLLWKSAKTPEAGEIPPEKGTAAEFESVLNTLDWDKRVSDARSELGSSGDGSGADATTAVWMYSIMLLY